MLPVCYVRSTGLKRESGTYKAGQRPSRAKGAAPGAKAIAKKRPAAAPVQIPGAAAPAAVTAAATLSQPLVVSRYEPAEPQVLLDLPMVEHAREAAEAGLIAKAEETPGCVNVILVMYSLIVLVSC